MNKIVIILLIVTSFSMPLFAKEQAEDNFPAEWYNNKPYETIEPNLDYNYSSLKREKIWLTPVEKYSTPHNVYDGMPIKLRVKKNVRIGKKLLKHGTSASAIIELSTTNGMTGIPATITIGRVKIPGLEPNKLYCYYVKEGQNRTVWILPLKWALTWIPFVGSFTNLIKGGQAVLKPADDIPVYYFYDW